jgi:hypothetical protein
VTVQLLIPAKILEEEEDDLLFYCVGVMVQKTFSRKENK